MVTTFCEECWRPSTVCVLSQVQLFAIPWMVAHQALLSVAFSRQGAGWAAISSSHRHGTSGITFITGATRLSLLAALCDASHSAQSCWEERLASWKSRGRSLLSSHTEPAPESDSHRDHLSQDAESRADEESFIYEWYEILCLHYFLIYFCVCGTLVFF